MKTAYSRVTIKELQKIIKRLEASLLYATELAIEQDQQRLKAITVLRG